MPVLSLATLHYYIMSVFMCKFFYRIVSSVFSAMLLSFTSSSTTTFDFHSAGQFS